MRIPYFHSFRASACTMRFLVVGLLLAIMVSVLPAQEDPTSTIPRHPSLADIAEAYRRQEHALESLSVTSRYSTKFVGDVSQIQKIFGDQTVGFMDTQEVQVLAFKGVKRFLSEKLSDSFADTNVEVQEIRTGTAEPRQTVNISANKINAFDGKSLLRRNAGGHSAVILDPSDPSDVSGLFEFEYLIDIYRTIPNAFDPEHDRGGFSLAKAIDSGVGHLRPEFEDIDGSPCVVIEFKQSFPVTVWLDPTLGFAVKKAEWQTEYGRKVIPMRTTCSDFAEVCDHLWLPKKVLVQTFADVASRSEGRDPFFQRAHDVEAIHANDVADELFTLQIPEGMLMIDHCNFQTKENGETVPSIYYAPAATDGPLAHLRASPATQSNNRIGVRQILVWSAMGLMLAAAVGLLIVQRRG